jgi:5-methyltetrahydrofolate--homocysteine methyltransferase
VRDLDEKMAQGAAPLEIINGPLMAGMAEVGRLFNDNQLIVAEVLQSAEAMKAAVSHLERFMEKKGAASRGRMILATVKGDVHDIGKNLVDIVLSNNGYSVVNLGIKIAPEALIEAVRRHEPDMIGLSGLLVKSAHQMVVTAEDLSRAGVEVPLLVGGAALSETFTLTKIAPAYLGPVLYAKDAMAGLRICDRLQGNGSRVELLRELDAARETAAGKPARVRVTADPGEGRSARIAVLDVKDVPRPPDLERHVEHRACLARIWPWINPQALYGRHLGVKGRWAKLLEEKDPTAMKLDRVVRDIQREGEEGAMTARAVWQWFHAESEGNVLRVFDASGRTLEEFTFQRQRKPDGVCIADWVQPKGAGEDWICVFVTTAGQGIRQWSEELRHAGEYLRSHAVQALAVETAEAYAEMLHADLRAAWGFPDPETMTMMDRFRTRYRGIRVSFGYPACPDLEDQAKLWRLLRPEEIGVELTEGFMMDPEASVSALVFHHPQAEYFGVGAVEGARE